MVSHEYFHRAKFNQTNHIIEILSRKGMFHCFDQKIILFVPLAGTLV